MAGEPAEATRRALKEAVLNRAIMDAYETGGGSVSVHGERTSTATARPSTSSRCTCPADAGEKENDMREAMKVGAAFGLAFVLWLASPPPARSRLPSRRLRPTGWR